MGGLSVMRDILSHQGMSDRTHGRYLLRFTNGGHTARQVHFIDQFPFFVRPLWHTLRLVVQESAGVTEEFSGLHAMQRVGVSSVPSAGHKAPTGVPIVINIAPAGAVSVFLDVLKSFIPVGEFSSACEKGFDVGSAAWFEQDIGDPPHSAAVAATVVAGDPSSFAAAERLRFTEGLLVLVPMPDFSMPFNVIALSSTALCLFFGSIFRLTAAGRLPHWVTKKALQGRSRLFWASRVFLGLVAAALYGLSVMELEQVQGLRKRFPDDLGWLVDFLVTTKGQVDELLR